MTCPHCGKPRPCAHSWKNSAVLVDHQVDLASEPDLSSLTSPRDSNAVSAQPTPADRAWRREVASRVQQHRARRRKHADPNAMELDFTADEPYSFAAESHDYELPPPPPRFAEIVVKQETPKIIRFPRSTRMPVPAVDEVTLDELALADPGLETPRIFFEDPATGPGEETATQPREAPGDGAREIELPYTSVQAQQMDLLPNFEDIRLEPETNRLTDELKSIPKPAALSQRAIAGVV
ncbi:MAG: hypothetical protein WA738_13395, partial [Candidatus Angelobacter sp.]